MPRRPDVQGLRALAVLAVVAYHAGLPLPGGFVGVDVFFVVSGFVITSMLRREREATGRIAFGTFYLRRFKRLFPALAVVVAFVAVASSLALAPGPQEEVAQTGIGALFSFANWVIAWTTGGYFDAPAAANPLLATWSLSVEEQFYLFFPAVLALCWLSRRRAVAFAVVGVLTVGSLAAMLVGGRVWLLGFYGPVARAWEFGAGSLVALATARCDVGSRKAAILLSALGLEALLIAGSVVGAGTRWPGLWTLLPVGGTVLLLLGGTNAASPLTKLLSVRPLAAVGDWSYSIYLWHWPPIVFAVALWPHTPHVREYAALASFAPAVLSYRLVEQPFRFMEVRPARRLALLATALVAMPFAVDSALAATVKGVWSPGFEQSDMTATYPGEVGEAPFYAHIASTYPPCAGELLAHALYFERTPRCAETTRRTQPTIALIGDSHAEQLFPALAARLPGQNILYDIVDDLPTIDDPDFARIVDAVVATPSIHTVVIASYWPVRNLTRAGQLVPTLRALHASGRRVFLTDDVGYFSFDATACKYRKSVLQVGQCSEGAAPFWNAYATYDGALRTAARDVPGVHLISTAGSICSRTVCSMVHDGQLLYRDSNHLNIVGSRFVAAAMLRDPLFARATAGRRPPLH